jgi:uncharacterized protein (DUF2141 family)
MALMLPRRARWSGVVAAFALVASAAASEPTTITISGTVTGGSGHHSIYIALWSEQQFLGTPAQTLHFPPTVDARYRFTAPTGRWAVSAFEDRNDNGKLDMGLFGPKEPNGFWREFRGHHKPRFEEVATVVEHDVGDANITLR